MPSACICLSTALRGDLQQQRQLAPAVLHVPVELTCSGGVEAQ